jgi:hypothetical protein
MTAEPRNLSSPPFLRRMLISKKSSNSGERERENTLNRSGFVIKLAYDET